MREIYLPGFKAAVEEGGVLTVMSAYNKVRGKWCSENKYLLTDILKTEWGFPGVVLSDWDGVHSTYDAAIAGLDIEMGTLVDNYKDYYFADELKKAVLDGKIGIDIIDDKVRRILTSMFKSNVFSNERSKGEYISKRNFEVAKNVAEEAVVLLKNKDNILPLKENEIKTLAVIGENAIIKQAAGGGSSGIKAKYEITPLEGLKNRVGDKIKINFAQGYKSTTTFDWADGVNDTSEVDAEYKTELRDEAVEIVKDADYVIMFVGLSHHQDMESVDRPDMNLPYGQDKLIKEVLENNKNTIVVLISGSAVDISQWGANTPAIIQGWYAGSEAGNVFADILFGDVNPSGKLPFTFPKKLEDSPAHKLGDYPGVDLNVEYKEGIFVGYRYFDTFDVEPEFAFGHGLSYSTFSYNTIKLSDTKLSRGNQIEITVKIENSSSIAGSEVVQLYVEDVSSSVKRPIKELKGFKKVFLNAGEVIEVKFKIDETMLSYYDVSSKAFKAESGQFKIQIGSASDDIRLIEEFELL